MRRSTTAIVLALLAVGFLLAAPEIRGWALIGCMLALIAAIPISARRRAGTTALVPWAISFAVSAAISVPLLVSDRYESVGGHVFFGLILWVVLAALLRLVIFLADYFRQRLNGSGAKT